MKADAARIAAIARAWPADLRLVLLHGPDESASRDMAGQVAAGLGAGVTITELAGNALKSDPSSPDGRRHQPLHVRGPRTGARRWP